MTAEQTKNTVSSGGLWEKVSKKTNAVYLFGKLQLKDGETVLFRAVKNEWKQEGENTPDYRIFLAEDNQVKSKPVKVASKPAPKVVEQNEEEDGDGQL